MDEPNPRPEDLYKRPEELFHHPKPAPNYGESPSPPNKKRFQSNLGKHRGKKPFQVGTDEIGLMAKSILKPFFAMLLLAKTKTNTITPARTITNSRLDH